MACPEHRAYAYATYFLAFNGLSKFHYNIRTHRLERSPFLNCYCILQNVIMLCGLPLTIYNDAKAHSLSLVQTNFFQFLIIVHFVVFTNTIVSCVCCTQLEQCRIREIIMEIQRIRRCLGSAQGSANRTYFYGHLLLLTSYSSIMLLMDWRSYKSYKLFDLLCFGWKFWCSLMITASYLVTFSILWNISHCCCSLNKSLTELQYRTVQHRELYRMQRLQQQLLSLNIEFSGSCNYILSCFIMRTAWHCIIFGYLVIRIYLGHSFINYRNKPLYPILCIHCMLILYALGSLAESVSRNLLQSVHTFDQPQLKQSNSWLALQLIRQNIEVRIYGNMPLNRRLVFALLAQMLLYMICLIQGDYHKL